MNLILVIFAAAAVFFLPVGWRLLRRQFNSVVDHFEEDEAIARKGER